ncbi:MAG: STAS/SEC14 domain-containing protein [Planctomycetes bacterium]|nr:STAS/SEC14 domain-containing protein [Planctomycetota bacterium]
MLACHVVPGSNVVELTLDGAVSKDDFDRARTALESVIAERGHVCVLKHVRSLGSFPLTRVVADLEFALRHMTDVARMAIVVERPWMEHVSRLLVHVVPCEARIFDVDEIDDARDWLCSWDHPDELADGHVDTFHVTA